MTASLTLSDFDFALPRELIAQHPARERSAARLLDASTEPARDRHVRDLPELLRAGDLLVVNDTAVIKARLFGVKTSGGAVEALVERIETDGTVLAQVRASKSPKAGAVIRFASAFDAQVLGRAGSDESLFRLRFPGEPLALLERHGHVPLPPYIERADEGADVARYQTVFAAHPGAVAAPTAALHFDDALLAALAARGIERTAITLHVGAGTFQPVRSEKLAEHAMHSERFTVGADAVAAIERARAPRRPHRRRRHDEPARPRSRRRGKAATASRCAPRRARPISSSLPAFRFASSTCCSPTSICRRARCSCWSPHSPGMRASAPLRARDRRALSLLQLRRRDAARARPGAAVNARRAAALVAAAAIVATVALGPPPAAAAGYATEGRCAGRPRVALKVPAGWCLALVADAANGLVFPRRVIEVAPGRYWLADMGSWEAGRGRLLQFDLPVAAEATPPAMTVLADKLDRPHGLALGPDGRVYVGEAGRIWRTPVTRPIVAETVLAGLPAEGAHPLKEIVFGEGGRMFVNVGSSSDACRDAAGAAPLPCPDLSGLTPRAAVYEATFAGPAFTLQSFKPYATGLRNSMALAWTAPGVLLQGENSIDYADEAAPPEELNLVRAGANYGWPYCVGARQPARGYEKRFDCAKTEAPALLWPAHAAPLQMIAVPKAANNPFAGQLVVAWHGYRAAGHRVVSFALDAQGRPSGPPRSWVEGWSAQRGARPLGAPAGILVDSAGRLLIVEDRNRTLLMLVRESASPPAPTIR